LFEDLLMNFLILKSKQVKTSFWHDPLDWESYWGPSRIPHLGDLDPFC